MIKKIIKRILEKTGYRINSTKYILKPFLTGEHVSQLEFDHVLSKYLTLSKENGKPFHFIQIGAFDGVECDPLYKYLQKFDWNGIMLEPQPGPFDKLKKMYAERPHISVLNAAISNSNGNAPMYVIEGNSLPEWAKGMASFSKENIVKHDYLLHNVKDHVREIEVQTITFEKLFSDHSINHLDLLQIDTEGFDADILNMFPFDRIKPRLIHFESKHIPREKLEKLLQDLIGRGYKIARDREEDMIAFIEDK